MAAASNSAVGVSVSGAGRALPERVVTNSEIARRLGVDPEWIESRTGIRERRFAGPGESASTLSIAAAKQALRVAGVMGNEIDLVIVSTSTPDHLFPPTASIVQKALKADSAGAFDLNAACSGFVYGLTVASNMIAGGMRRVLIVGVDVLSHHINLDDPVTAPLFGDGAGAILLEKDESAEPLRFELGSDGGGAQHVMIPAGGSCIPTSVHTLDRGLHWIRMAGREVYRSAVRAMTGLGTTLGAGGFDLLIAHQANRRILEECAIELGIDLDRLYINIDRYGNTSSASIPIAISEAWEIGRLVPGLQLLLLAFGAGYTWGGAKLRWTLANPNASSTDSKPRALEVPA